LRRIGIDGGASQDIAAGAFVEGARCAVAPATLCAVAERSADGRTLVFSSLDPHRGRLAELLRWPQDAGAEYRWALSPTGDEIALANTAEPVVHFVTLSDHVSRAVHVAGTSRLGYLSWLPDRSGVVLPRYGAHGASLIALKRDGESRVIWQQPGAIDISGIPSPDGSHIAIWIRTRNASLWLADSP